MLLFEQLYDIKANTTSIIKHHVFTTYNGSDTFLVFDRIQYLSRTFVLVNVCGL